jgi:hypothetical protein
MASVNHCEIERMLHALTHRKETQAGLPYRNKTAHEDSHLVVLIAGLTKDVVIATTEWAA